ncbi:hypothetical protein BJ165DRAFT_1510232 [Panaeolus papilionaceus]|nr:hypothetical protein BJ165DRAFT_1510232 [Panaeolus papilionaceus]
MKFCTVLAAIAAATSTDSFAFSAWSNNCYTGTAYGQTKTYVEIVRPEVTGLSERQHLLMRAIILGFKRRRRFGIPFSVTYSIMMIDHSRAQMHDIKRSPVLGVWRWRKAG